MSRPNRSGWRRALIALLASASLWTAAPAGAGNGGAPATALSADGRTVSGAGKTLTVSHAAGLSPAGQSITVSGSGYDEAKGVYVSLCVIPPVGTTPTPCGGGVDREDTSGASEWVSSNPPSYATGLSQPYGSGGSFSVSIDVSPAINATLDCRQVRCAVVTRNDHTRGSDRSQDLLVPVTFADPADPTPPTDGGASDPTTTTAPPPQPTTTTTTLPPTAFAPAAELTDDGHRVDDGSRAMTVSSVTGLDPAGAEVTIDGSGFPTGVGVYVALCAVPAANGRPDPCGTGAESSAWLSSSPPDYGVDLAEPFADDGSFSVALEVSAAIDATTDCREVPCAIAVRRDDTAPDDRTSDLFVPVRFLASSPTTTTRAPATTTTAGDVTLAAATDDDGGSAAGLLPVALVAIGSGAVGFWALRRRSAAS